MMRAGEGGDVASILDVAPDPTLVVSGSVVVAILVGIAAVVVGVLSAIKRALVTACPVGLRFRSAEPGDYPTLDRHGLDRYSEQFESAGFVRIADYTIGAEHGTVHPGFARLFADAQRDLYAEVNQLFPSNQAVPLRVTINTRFPNGWSATTTDRDADAAVWMLRRPESCWQSIPGESIDRLLVRHLELCDRIALRTGDVGKERVSVENWYDAERRNAETVRTTIERRYVAVLLWEYFTYTKRTAWFGALETARSNGRNDYN